MKHILLDEYLLYQISISITSRSASGPLVTNLIDLVYLVFLTRSGVL
jgi:hypothetical protein